MRRGRDISARIYGKKNSPSPPLTRLVCSLHPIFASLSPSDVNVPIKCQSSSHPLFLSPLSLPIPRDPCACILFGAASVGGGSEEYSARGAIFLMAFAVLYHRRHCTAVHILPRRPWKNKIAFLLQLGHINLPNFNYTALRCPPHPCLRMLKKYRRREEEDQEGGDNLWPGASYTSFLRRWVFICSVGQGDIEPPRPSPH